MPLKGHLGKATVVIQTHRHGDTISAQGAEALFARVGACHGVFIVWMTAMVDNHRLVEFFPRVRHIGWARLGGSQMGGFIAIEKMLQYARRKNQ
jgi:hypothetical protein